MPEPGIAIGAGLEKVAETTPRRRSKAVVPREPAPPTSSRARVALTVAPQAPLGTKEKVRETAGPTGESGP